MIQAWGQPAVKRGGSKGQSSSRYNRVVEQWRPLAQKYFGKEADKALWVIQHESGGNPFILGDGGRAKGLFQNQHISDGLSPEQQFAAAKQLYTGRRSSGGSGWEDWGENNSYNGQRFGALGNHPYPGGASSPGVITASAQGGISRWAPEPKHVAPKPTAAGRIAAGAVTSAQLAGDIIKAREEKQKQDEAVRQQAKQNAFQRVLGAIGGYGKDLAISTAKQAAITGTGVVNLERLGLSKIPGWGNYVPVQKESPIFQKATGANPSKKQYLGSALATGALVFPGSGKVISSVADKVVPALAKAVVRQKAKRSLGGAATRAATSAGQYAPSAYSYDVGSKLADNQNPRQAFKPGLTTVLGTAIPGAGSVVKSGFRSLKPRTPNPARDTAKATKEQHTTQPDMDKYYASHPEFKQAPAQPHPLSTGFAKHYAPMTKSSVEKRAASHIKLKPKTAMKAYNKRVKDRFGSDNVVSTDEAKHILPGFKPEFSNEFHSPASALARHKYDELLARTDTKHKPVLITGGGAGAGKTTSLKGEGGYHEYAAVVDTNLTSEASAQARIDEALKSGREVDIDYTYRDPVKALREGVIRRVQHGGHIVNLEAFTATHLGSNKVIRHLAEKYKNDKRVTIRVHLNTAKVGEAKLGSIDKLPEIEYNKDKALTIFTKEVQNAHNQGKISEAEAKAFFKSGRETSRPHVSQVAEKPKQPEKPHRTDRPEAKGRDEKPQGLAPKGLPEGENSPAAEALWERKYAAHAEDLNSTVAKLETKLKAATKKADRASIQIALDKANKVSAQWENDFMAEAKALSAERPKGSVRPLKKPGSGLPISDRPSQLKETAKEVSAPKNEEGAVKVGKGSLRQKTPEAKVFESKVLRGKPKVAKLSTAKKMKHDVWTQVFDKYDTVKRLGKDYQQLSGKKLDVLDDPYKQARLAAGITNQVQLKIHELGSVIREAPDVQLLKEVGVAKRIIGDRSGMKNPISVGTAQRRLEQIKAELGDEGYAKTEEVVQKVVNLHDDMLKYLTDNGIISQEAFDAIKAKNKNYFGKFDVVDYLTENSESMRVGKSFNVAKQDVIKAQKGTQKAIADPIEATIRQWSRAIDLVERNRVGQALHKMAVDPEFEAVRLLEDGHPVPIGYGKFQTFINGSKVDMVVPKEVEASLKHLTPVQADFVTSLARGAFGVSLLRKTATSLNIPFALIRNPLRDFKTFLFNSDYVPLVKVGAAWVRGFANAIDRGTLFKEFMANKGGQSTFFNQDARSIQQLATGIERSRAEKLGRTITSPKQLFGIIPAIEQAGFSFEMAPRLAEFQYAVAKQMKIKPGEVKGYIKDGKVPTNVLQEAAFAGRNITVDFSESGTVGQIANQWVPFLNARTQGTRKTAQAIIRHPQRAAVVAATTVATPAILSYVWNREKHPEIYDQIPQYVKDNYFLLIYGNGKDADGNPTDVIKIPKSDPDRVFGNSIENFMEYLYHKEPQTAAQTILEAFSSTSPIDFVRDGHINFSLAVGGILPPAPKGLIENLVNHSFYMDRPVVSQKLSELPANEQKYDSTSGVAIKIGQLTGWSPAKIDNFLRSVLANQVQQATDPIDTVTRTVKGASGRNVENKFYNVYTQLTPQKASINNQINQAILKGDTSRAYALADKFNSQIDKSYSNFDRLYGQYLTEDLKQRRESLKFNLTDRGIQQRYQYWQDKGN